VTARPRTVLRRVARWLPVLLALAAPGVAFANTGQESQLAARYAPVVKLVAQPVACGHGEPYLPIDVNVLFDEPTVALRGPWSRYDLVKIGPTAADLGRGLYEYHLDFPGDALQPGCDYEQWQAHIVGDTKPTVYAHVATEPGHPGLLALQYWFFYVFNDWNNLHEGDWEMIQLVFQASSVADALHRAPFEVGYSQHEGAERARWDDPKLQIVDGTHPVVHPAAGSHANFFGEALYLGASGSQGVGCDDTLGPTNELRPVVRTIPQDPAAARRAYPWIAFEGRWGELQRAFYNGPTGPNLKTQWTEPITWSQGWRDRSYAVPGGGVLGTSTTTFFCGAVAGGSAVVTRFVDDPGPVLLVLAGLIVLLLLVLGRVTWRPTAPLRVGRRRAWGQILAAAARMYGRRFPLFVAIGLMLIPITVLTSLLQSGVFWVARLAGIEVEAQTGGILALLVVAIGTSLTLLGLGLVQAATARALVEIDQGRPVGPLQAYRLAFRRTRPLLGAIVIAVVVVSLLAGSLVLLPVALWLAVWWALVVPVVELEGLSATAALRRSGQLVRGEWLKVITLTVVGAGLALLAGPLIGGVLIILTDTPLWVLNLVSGVVYAIAMPFVALTTMYVYFDARVRNERATPAPSELPPEIDVAPGTPA
jgi:hypothetical protein